MASTYIDREECIGDSLLKLNSNFSGLDTNVSNLLTLINTLSTNMNQIMNVPYASFAMKASHITDYGANVGQGEPIATSSGNGSVITSQQFGFTKTYVNTTSITNNLGVFTIPAGTYEVKIDTSTIQMNSNEADTTIYLTPSTPGTAATAIFVAPCIHASAGGSARLSTSTRINVTTPTNYIIKAQVRFRASGGICFLNASDALDDVVNVQFYKVG